MKTIEVYGLGTFPIDMLRYDQACPADPDSAARLLNNVSKGPDRKITRDYPIRLNVYNVSGPTWDRWGSFMWLGRVV